MKSRSGIVFVCAIALIMGCSRGPDQGQARNNSMDARKILMTIEQSRAKQEAAIRELVDGFTKAIRAKDMNGVMSVFAPEVVSFDIGPPLQHGGGETFVKRWQALFDTYEGGIDYEVRDLRVDASDNVAFSYSLNRVSGTLKNGQKAERWLRWTACYRKINGRWLIIHEQVSVPVDLRTGRAMLDLAP